MSNMVYMWEGHTLISLGEGQPKQKVSHGEIIDIPDELISRAKMSGFVRTVETKVIDDGKDEISVDVEKKAKKK